MDTHMDLGSILKTAGSGNQMVSHTTRETKQDLDMTDFLTLMVTQLQSQTIDNTADTSDMLNQLVQMQMVTSLNNVTDATVMTYASSLVGKEVTVGVYSGNKLEEKVVTITGTGYSNGQQVLFAGNDMYSLSSVMAVGRLPSEESRLPDEEEEGDGTTDPKDPVEGGGTDPKDPVEGGGTDPQAPIEGGSGDGSGVENTEDTENTGNSGVVDNPNDNPSGVTGEEPEESQNPDAVTGAEADAPANHE